MAGSVSTEVVPFLEATPEIRENLAGHTIPAEGGY